MQERCVCHNSAKYWNIGISVPCFGFFKYIVVSLRLVGCKACSVLSSSAKHRISIIRKKLNPNEPHYLKIIIMRRSGTSRSTRSLPSLQMFLLLASPDHHQSLYWGPGVTRAFVASREGFEQSWLLQCESCKMQIHIKFLSKQLAESKIKLLPSLFCFHFACKKTFQPPRYPVVLLVALCCDTTHLTSKHR